jgi:probable DNA repair protein
MLSPLINIALFRDAIDNNHLILTANQRLASQIHQAWGQSKQAEASVWPMPRVMSMEHWLTQCWHELQDQNHPLAQGLAEAGHFQSLYYWERAIAKHEQQPTSNFATMANNCLDLLQRWNLTIEDIPYSTASIDKFRHWANSYKRLLEHNQLVSTATTWALVKEGFCQGALAKEPLIALYGFQSISPLQTAVIETAGEKTIYIRSSDKNISTQKVCCIDANRELESAAKWAAGELAKNPHQRIGILIPDLNQTIQRAARVINEALASYNCPITVNISAGIPLSESPLIRSALDLLNLFNYKQPLERWIHQLYCPFSLFEDLPIQFKVDCELALRDHCSYQLSIDKFVQTIRHTESKITATDTVKAALDSLYKAYELLKKKSSGRQTFSGWAVFFEQFIALLGWPGTRELNSLEYQQRQQWQRLLATYCELDTMGIEFGRAAALNYLQRIASEQIFHPQTGDAPLQILGLLEGSGLVFDQLWIIGAHSENFPSAQPMDALLPAQFQRAQAMPHSVPEKELHIANQLLRDYRANAKKLIFSWPLKDNESTLETSPLIKDIPPVELDKLVPSHSQLAPWLIQDYQCNLIVDTAPPFNAQVESIRGGSGILKNQSTCPFNAFAIHRLGAEPLKEPLLGLSPMVRGNLVHEILYRLWKGWKTSQQLSQLSAAEISDEVDRQVDAVLTEQGPKNPVLLGIRYKQLEHQRLVKLILQWLELEKTRPSFNVIATEQRASISFGQLKLSLQIDRIDSIDGKQVIIDYKTGNVSANDWLGERPKDPQLPLYLLANPTPLAGCTFAQLKSNNLKFNGLSESQLIPDIRVSDNWSLQVQEWQSAADNLASEFIQGNSQLRVYNKTAFAYQNYLLPLNRWHEYEAIRTQLKSSDRQLEGRN